MLYFERGSVADKLSLDDLRKGLSHALDRLGPRQRVLVIPPDFTRFHSHAGVLTKLIYDYYGARLTDVLPALGTHTPMTPAQIAEMFAGVPENLFRVHNWRTGITTVGEVPRRVRETGLAAGRWIFPGRRNWPISSGPANTI